MTFFANHKRSERHFAVGDWVFLRLQPYRQSTMGTTKCPKLSPWFYGPYQILAKIRAVAYKLALPPGSKIHSVFHVSLLKKKIGSHLTSSPTLPPLLPDSSVQWTPTKILNRGLFKLRNQPVVRWLIQWSGLPEEDATWEDATNIERRLPQFQT